MLDIFKHFGTLSSKVNVLKFLQFRHFAPMLYGNDRSHMTTIQRLSNIGHMIFTMAVAGLITNLCPLCVILLSVKHVSVQAKLKIGYGNTILYLLNYRHVSVATYQIKSTYHKPLVFVHDCTHIP